MNRHWRLWRPNFRPGVTDIAVFLVCSALMVFRVPMPVEAASNFTYSHPWLSLITLFPILVWLTGAYFLGAAGLIIWIARFFLLALRR